MRFLCGSYLSEMYTKNYMSQAEEISKWKKLLDEGAITEEEFNRQKQKILSKKTDFQLSKFNMPGIVFLLLIFGVYIYFNSNGGFTSNDENTANDNMIVETTIEIEELETKNELIIDTLEDISSGVVQILMDGVIVTPDEDFNFFDAAVKGKGSGFVISSNGYIVTNNHVVAGASLVQVLFAYDDKPINAQIVATSECSDLALLKIEKNDLKYFAWSDLNPIYGDEIYAAGFPLGNPEFTLLDGIITKQKADGEKYWASIEETFEHNAEIKQGNSGGPIIRKSDFTVIGVAYAGDVDNQEFAINSNLASTKINSMISGESKPGFGINGEQWEGIGIYIYSVERGSPLDKAGVLGGDIITSLNDIDLYTESTLKTYCNILDTKTSSAEIPIVILRSTEDFAVYTGILNTEEKISTVTYYADTSSNQDSGSTNTTAGSTNTTAGSTNTTINQGDNQPPVWSSDPISFSRIGTTSFDILWGNATDNIGVSSYQVIINGSVFTEVSKYIHRVSYNNASPNTQYNVEIIALDAARNYSTNNPTNTVITDLQSSSSSSSTNTTQPPQTTTTTTQPPQTTTTTSTTTTSTTTTSTTTTSTTTTTVYQNPVLNSVTYTGPSSLTETGSNVSFQVSVTAGTSRAESISVVVKCGADEDSVYISPSNSIDPGQTESWTIAKSSFITPSNSCDAYISRVTINVVGQGTYQLSGAFTGTIFTFTPPDTTAPVITSVSAGWCGVGHYNIPGQGYLYNGHEFNRNYSISVSDNVGLSSVSVTANGVTNSDSVSGTSQTVTGGTGGAQMQENSSYTVSITVVDTSGNTSTPYTVTETWPSVMDAASVGCNAHNPNTGNPHTNNHHSHP